MQMMTRTASNTYTGLLILGFVVMFAIKLLLIALMLDDYFFM